MLDRPIGGKYRLIASSDGNIRYFEYEHDKFEYLSEYKSADPQRGVAFLPKRGVNTHENEVMRAFKTVNDSYIEPISFIVPRRAEVFQGDIYPPVTGTKPAMSAADWFDGKEGLPPKIDLESVYEGEEPTEIPSSSRSVSQVPSASTSKQAAKPIPSKKAPEPAVEPPQPSPAIRNPPPSMKEQTNSIASLASKYDDKEDTSSGEDDSSSFEEVAKPIERHTPKPVEQPVQATEPAAITRKLSSPVSPTKLAAPISPSKPASSASPSMQSAPANAATSSDQITLQDIKTLLESQSKTISGQSEKIALLTAEVDRLKTTIGDKM